jgi:serine protease Do
MEEAALEGAKTSAQKTLGMAVQTITPQIAQQLGIKTGAGVVVTRIEPGSAADDAQIQTGDVILEVDRKPVRNAEDFRQKVGQVKGKESLLLLVQRGENSLFVAVQIK